MTPADFSHQQLKGLLASIAEDQHSLYWESQIRIVAPLADQTSITATKIAMGHWRDAVLSGSSRDLHFASRRLDTAVAALELTAAKAAS